MPRPTRRDPVLQHRQHDIGFGHEASKKAVQLIARQLGLPYDHYVSTHARFGNTVSASVPLGMSIASKRADCTAAIACSCSLGRRESPWGSHRSPSERSHFPTLTLC